MRLTVPSRLFLASAAMLFLELALIRWIGENVLYVSYFSNFVLLAAFLGIGLGFLAGGRDARWIRWLPYLLLGLIGVIVVFPVHLDRSVGEVLLLGSGTTSGLPPWILLPAVFVAVAAVMAAVGQEVARLFGQLEPLRAYRLDILGSIAGILAFTGLSFLGSPPVVWAGATTAVLLVVAADAIGGPHRLALFGVVLVLGLQSFSPNLIWSPYYELTVEERGELISIGANGVPHQAMAPTASLAAIDWIAGWPYEVLPSGNRLDRVLVIGAGSGNDVAFALRNGARVVDAVEIDPVIQELGVRHHPDAPYDDPRVVVHIDDGRAFMERTANRYDLILFAVTDSLTLISGQSSLRLESYLFTVESVERATALLKDRGVVSFYNLHSEDWIIARMADTLRTATQGDVCMIRDPERGPGVMLAAGPGITSPCTNSVTAPTSELAPPTDDSPFLYVRSVGIPAIYSVALGLILLAAFGSVRAVAGPLRGLRRYSDLFLMGVAFLLLETKGVVQFALWFGTTWLVNSLVFAGILVSVWLAIEVASRLRGRIRLPTLYRMLFVALAASWAVPPALLLELPFGLRLLAATAVTFGPVFVANLLFAERFRTTAKSTTAFGANLLGAMIGGTLEYASLVIGHRSLILLAALAYLGAYATWQRVGGEPATRPAAGHP